MATGQNIQPARGIVTTDVTPNIDFNDGSPELWASAGRLARSVEQALKPGLERRARELGAADGADAATRLAAGEDATVNRPRFAFGDLAAAREDAAFNAFHARIRNDIDARESEVRTANPANLSAYREQMGSVRSAFIQNAPPEFAVDLETYLNDRIENGAASVANAASAVSLREEALDLAGREGSLRRQMVDVLDAAGGPTPEYESLRNEWETLRDQRLANPAIPYSQAEADEDERALVTLSKGAVYTAHIRTLLRTEGAPAALEAVQGILTDPDLGATDRLVVFERVRSAINTEIDVATDQANMANASRERADREIQRRIEAVAGAIEVGAQPPALTEAEILASPGGLDALAKYHRLTAEAAERNRLTGSLVGLPREEALTRARLALGGTEGTTLSDLGDPLKNPAAFDAFAAAIQQVETGNNPRRISRDPDGAGGAAGGAVGAMQLKEGTAREAARRLGIPFDANRLLNDVAYNQQLGREELRHLLTRYDGNAQLAATAYYAGPGLVDAWTRPVGTLTRVNVNGEWKDVAGKGDPRDGDISFAQWIDAVGRAGNPLSAAYPRKVAEALAGGRASAEWRDQQATAIVT
ncbi:MAG TPA: transglycosylase SLT domain-containing protein, partial [Brevundimonas sp.]|nr:transglycosylase SLT domain-containing protein [Brevundimonas sp.]